ncbi:MAG TPA: bifunctional alpha,alpha-trehalose-phosphate synthase (UDP-forming)/trehalose-phosphatase [Cryomorphaceae bacterium]|nr:bifunctional alpha,alpha-trehalose-phosphate synthase (UDP-forming)/trehalose-phosphatase [Cryomorphaceae bacterium]
MSKTIIVSNRLPVRIEREGDELTYQSSEGGLATGLGSIYKEGNNIWIGWSGASFETDELKEEVTQGLAKESMRPVFLTEDEVESFYLGFSNQTLWPAFHYFVQYIDYRDDNWESYQRVNQKFADVISRNLEDDDTVWIHDYQLMLVPELLRKSHPNITIGFYQHIPFPSYEVFRTLPWRRELLEGVLGSDYIAFHTYDDMRHFLSSVHRLVGYPYHGSEIQTNSRVVVADSLPMGIDYEKYAENAKHPEAIERAERYRKALGGERLILSMDRLDYSKGIPGRLKAFDAFLEKYPEYKEKVSLLLIVVPSRDKVPNYQMLKEQVDELVGKINSKYGRMSWQPIHYYYRSYPFIALGSFYRMCDVAMITPLRDGMNLVCKEYVASRENKDGVLILSEMAGASKELSDAILVNPTDKMEMVEALKQALEMEPEEQHRRMELMQKTVKKYNIFNWVSLFFNNLSNVKKNQKDMAVLKLAGENEQAMLETYKKSANRLILLDYDGTLVEFNKDPMACEPGEKLRTMLSELGASDKNTVVIISGRKSETLEEWIGDMPVSLVAEHGMWSKDEGGSWQRNGGDSNTGWKDEVMDIMNFYVDRTPGSFVEEKSHSLAWHYRKVEKGLGEVRKSELTSHLKHMMNERGFHVLDGDHVVELKPDYTNKGRVAKQFHERVNPDFTICLGDDTTDEYMFEALPEDSFTIKVGTGTSHARFGLESVKEVKELLERIIGLG